MRVRWITTIVVLALIGCTRGYYQRQADNEVADILKEKDQYPEWKIEQYHVYADPRARFAAGGNPNRPPMPPDDDASWKTSPHPQSPGHAGVGRVENNTYIEILRSWDETNRTRRDAEIQAAKDDLAADNLSRNRRGAIQALFDGPLSNRAGFLLELDQAAELGVINAREYQSIREDLYLAALPVTQQRFSFAFQWTAIENAIRQWAGPTSSVGPQNNWQLNSSAGATKLFSTGALLTLAFANSVVFNFNNPARGFTTQSSINLDIVQPLLQGGGRAVTLEPLTQSERTLFYNIRAYAHFRETFYTSIAYGNGLAGDLATLAGGSTTGSPISTLAALGIASTDVSGQFKGYLPSLYRQLDLAVDRKYVADLEKALLLFKGFEEGGQVAPLQVDQVRSTLLSARNSVLKDIQDTSNSLDQFKLQLGVPANMILVLDDLPARDITRTLDRYYDVLATSDAAYKQVEALEPVAPEQMRAVRDLYTQHPLVRGTAFLRKLPAAWANWEALSDADIKMRLESLQKERRKLLDLKTDVEMQGKSLSEADAGQLKETEFEADLGGLEQALRRYEKKPWERVANESTRRQERNKSFRYVSYAGQVMLVWARNDQVAQVAGAWPTLPATQIEGIDFLGGDVELSEEAAIQAAMRNRFDLMNARAQVVDAWRQLAVTANALMGVLNVQYHLDSQTPPGGTRPLAFSNAGTNSELIINGQLPLVRIAERNAYKTALIDYERARRGLIALEDTIAAQVRFDVRQLHLFAENYRIQQKVLESLYSQVENSLEVIVAPVDPDALKASGTTGQANAAALTQQYLGALGSLNGSQTRMYDIWLSYLATRMQLYQDLERLPLDSRGVWIDEARSFSPAASGKVGYVAAPVQLPDRIPAPADVLPAARLGGPIPIEDR